MLILPLLYRLERSFTVFLTASANEPHDHTYATGSRVAFATSEPRSQTIHEQKVVQDPNSNQLNDHHQKEDLKLAVIGATQ